MSNQLDQEVQDILNSMYQPETGDPHEESQPRRTLNIYIEVEEQQEAADQPPTIESTLDEQEPATSTTNEANTPLPIEQTSPTHITEPQRTKRQRRTPPAVLLFLMLSLIGVLAGIGYAVLVPSWTPSASVTLVTASRQLTTTSTLQLVTNGTADPTKNQLPGRTLPAITMSQARTIPTTGTAYQAAQAAHGLITFYNAAPSVQIVQVGTLLTGADGVHVITDQDATIPAAIMPTEGQVTVYAHAALTGTTGNMRAGDIYEQCCRLNVFVANGAFHGGQDARTYQAATPQDITSVTNSVKTSLEQSVQLALQTQVQPSETLVAPLSCTSKVTPDHQPGEEATQVHVTIDETCTGTTYTTQALTTLATQNATQDANTRLGTGYTTTGVQTRIIQAYTTTHGKSELAITSVSLWAYPFTQEQQDSIKAMIAGASMDKAKATLLHMTGVQSVSITLKNSTTIPRDVQHIHLLFCRYDAKARERNANAVPTFQ